MLKECFFRLLFFLMSLFYLGFFEDAKAVTAQIQRSIDLGVGYMEQHNYSSAAAEFQKAINGDPGNAIAHVDLGIARYVLKDYPGAERELREAIRFDPNLPNAYYTLGLIYMVQNKHELAADQFGKVLKIDPNDSFVYYNLGVCLSKLGQRDRAIAQFKKAIELQPDNLSAYYNLSRELMIQNKKAEGEKALDRFKELQRTSKIATASKLEYQGQGKYAEVILEKPSIPLKTKAIPVKFVDVTTRAGISFVHNAGLKPSYTFGKPISSSQYSLKFALDNIVPLFGSGAAWGDYDNDGRSDLYIADCSTSKDAQGNRLYHNAGKGRFTDVTKKARVGLRGLSMGCVWGDYENDGYLDLLVTNYGSCILYHNNRNGTFTDVTIKAGVANKGKWAMGAAFADYDHDGDLDIYVTNFVNLKKPPKKPTFVFPWDFEGERNVLYRNNGNGTFTDVTSRAKVAARKNKSLSTLFTDFNLDRAIDFLVGNAGDSIELFSNDRDGTFKDVAKKVGLTGFSRITAIAAADYNKDGFVDLFFSGWQNEPYRLYKNLKGLKFSEDFASKALKTTSLPGGCWGASFLDYDNDSNPDLFIAGDGRYLLLRNDAGIFKDISAITGISTIQAGSGRGLAIADYDNDGDSDLFIVNNGGRAMLLRNDGGNRNNWLKIRTAGLSSNRNGLGAKVEIKAGNLRIKQEVRAGSGYLSCNSSDLLFGIANVKKVDLVRTLWPGGVTQTEIDTPARKTFTIKEVDRKGTSCPILYAWDGSKYQFVTDILGGAIIGYLISDGKYYYPDIDEYTRIDGSLLVPKDGYYSVQITDQLEEIAYIDRAELVVVDHPKDVEVFPNERLLSEPPYPEFGIFALKNLRPPVSAIDDQSHDILPLITHIDRNYPSDFKLLPWKGYAQKHSIVLDLGKPVSNKAALVLNGWVDYAHSTSNLAASQAGVELNPPSLEVIGKDGQWTTVYKDMGYPAGLPKAMTLDLSGVFPTDDHRIRITTNMPIYWDQILVGDISEGSFRTTRLQPSSADLHWLGYPKYYSPDGKEPKIYDYAVRSDSALFGDHIGNYTAYGDVTELLTETDDRYVITFHGDEMTVNFDARDLPEVSSGWERDFLLYTNGFGKDMDPNSAYCLTVEPLPFHGMSNYPYSPQESYPRDKAYQEFIVKYNTRPVFRNSWSF